MPQSKDPRPRAPLAAALAVSASAWAGVAAAIGDAHKAAQGVICGGATPHCAWCYAAAALTAVAVISFVVAVAPRAALARLPVRHG